MNPMIELFVVSFVASALGSALVVLIIQPRTGAIKKFFQDYYIVRKKPKRKVKKCR